MKLRYFILLLMIAPVAFNATAEKIYKTIDEKGTVVFSDKKTPGAEKIKVQPNVVDVKIPVMPEPAVVEKKSQAPSKSKEKQQVEETGRGTASGENLRRKIQNKTNGEGLKRPVNLPARGQGSRPAAAQGGRVGGR